MAHSDHAGHSSHHGGMHSDGIMENHGYVQSSMNEGAVSQLHGGSHGDMGHASHAGMAASPHSAMPHMMTMTFHGGFNETILFEQWDISSAGGLVGSFIAIFIIALMYEGLKYYRKHLLWQTYSGLQYCAVSAPDKAAAPDDPHIHQPGRMVERKTPTMLSAPHAWQTALHAAQVLVSYMLMLVFMTYNLWLCAAVVLGSAAGYFLFGWRESVVVDFTEHCH